MARHIRRSAFDEKHLSPGAALFVVSAALAAVIAGVVYLTNHPAGTGGGQDTVNQAQTTQQDQQFTTDKDSAAKQDGATATDSAKIGNDAQKDGSTTSQDAAKKDEAAKQGSDAKQSSDAKADDGSSANGSSSSEGTSGDGSSNGSSQGSSDSTSGNGSGSDSGSDSGSGSSSGSSSFSNAYGGSSGGSGSGPVYGKSSGAISAEACATCVAESGTLTASGIPWDDSVPQVGLDTSQNPYDHFGEYVEITYSGTTVTAQVVDCGAYGAGTSGIIVNPGVYNAFGFDSADDFGRCEVTYRFV